MNENLNLVEILKDCPKGTKLYSPVLGEVKFEGIDVDKPYPILVTVEENEHESSNLVGFTTDGRFLYSYKGECVLFPSKDQHDWSKFKVPVEKFDYSTLKPFDKILVRDYNNHIWKCVLFTCMSANHMLATSNWNQGIPYNDETKHLAGTTDMPDEKYIWWKQSLDYGNMSSKLNKFMSMTAMVMMMAGGNDMYSPDIIPYSTSSGVDESYKRKKCKSCSKYRSNTGCSYPLKQACSKYTKRK